MRQHHRNYPYRPPRQWRKKVPMATFIRFLRTYLSPFKWRVITAVLLIGANACSVYLIAFYTQIVVDHALGLEAKTARQIEQEEANTASEERPWRQTESSRRRPESPPEQGLLRTLDGSPLSARPPDAGRRLFLIMLLYGGSMITLNIMERIAQKTKVQVGRAMAFNLRQDAHRKVLDLHLGFHQSTTPGRLLARITSDVEVIQEQSLQLLILMARTFSLLIVGFAILAAVDWRIALLFVAVAPIYVIVNGTFRRQLRAIIQELRHTNSCLYGYVTQKIESIKAVQAYAREGLERLNMHRLSACFFRDAVSQQRKTATMQGLARILSGVTKGAVFLFSTNEALAGRMSVGQVLLLHGTVSHLFNPVMQLPQINLLSSRVQTVLGRLMEILETPVEITEAPDARPLPRPLGQGIEVHNLCFSHSEEAEPTIMNISLKVPAGQWLCLMGGSGSGKSTLLFLLARLYQPDSGEIYYDNIPLEKVSLKSLRENIGFVPQEPQIFSGTVRENLVYGKPDATPKEIMRAAEMAELHDFIMSMKIQYETIIGERGTRLSGGQRQRLALARALLTKPDILLLDDCTSALDADTERRIQNTLTRTLSGKTAVIASQRISMASRCHRIAVLENGVVTEYGSHQQLLDNNGFYARLHEQQQG